MRSARRDLVGRPSRRQPLPTANSRPRYSDGANRRAAAAPARLRRRRFAHCAATLVQTSSTSRRRVIAPICRRCVQLTLPTRLFE
jgi:hypothetical protein